MVRRLAQTKQNGERKGPGKACESRRAGHKNAKKIYIFTCTGLEKKRYFLVQERRKYAILYFSGISRKNNEG